MTEKTLQAGAKAWEKEKKLKYIKYFADRKSIYQLGYARGLNAAKRKKEVV